MLPCPFRPMRRPAEHVTQLRRLPLQAESGTFALCQTMVGSAVASVRNEHPMTQNTRKKRKNWMFSSGAVFLLQKMQQKENWLSDGQKLSCQGTKQGRACFRRQKRGHFYTRLLSAKGISSGLDIFSANFGFNINCNIVTH